MLGIKLGPLEEQPVLLTTESSLGTLLLIFEGYGQCRLRRKGTDPNFLSCLSGLCPLPAQEWSQTVRVLRDMSSSLPSALDLLPSVVFQFYHILLLFYRAVIYNSQTLGTM